MAWIGITNKVCLVEFMRNSELFVLAAKLVLMAGIDYKNHPDIKVHERDAIESGLRELEFFQPGFADRYTEQVASLAAGAIRKPGRPPKGF